MKTELFYYFILIVYLSLWTCQMIACHELHSLIILTDSYINLYRILDISLGILHLKTQKKFRNINREKSDKNDSRKVELFNHICTYQFKRLPILGSFVNGMFLAALLMSAAIEGIQTCLHVNHSAIGFSKSILLEHPLTYPCILIAFALIGIIMQWCSGKAHEICELELLSISGNNDSYNSSTESLFHPPTSISSTYIANSNYNNNKNRIRSQITNNEKNEKKIIIDELNVNNLTINKHLESGDVIYTEFQNNNNNNKRKFYSLRTTKSVESIPSNLSDNSNVSLKSLRIISNLDDIQNNSVEKSSISKIFTELNSKQTTNLDSYLDENKQLEHDEHKVEFKEIKKSSTTTTTFAYLDEAHWALIRYFTSPLALISCALTVYFINHELVTEIADASLAIIVVILLFSASYPPMKKAGRVLLQTAPIGLEPRKLKNKIESLNSAIIDVNELKIWSLTTEGNRIGTCHLTLDSNKIKTNQQLILILKDVRKLFLKNNIRCTTIQPILIDPNVLITQIPNNVPQELSSQPQELTTTITTHIHHHNS